jgi:hypothetical protein
MRNRHFAEYWLGVVSRGCELAMSDHTFARIGGAAFGGVDVRPLDTLARIWAKGAGSVLAESGSAARAVAGGQIGLMPAVADLGRWYSGWWGSIADDPGWHARWLADVTGKWLRLPGTMRLRDPRAAGPTHLRISEQIRPRAGAYSAPA